MTLLNNFLVFEDPGSRCKFITWIKTEGDFRKTEIKHLDNFYKHPLWHQNAVFTADELCPGHEQSTEKHAGYELKEGQACPEEGTGESFLVS